MRKPINTERALNKFGKAVVQQSRSRLTKEKKNATSDLYNSLSFTPAKISNNGNIVSFSFEMLDYGEYVDKGVSGVDQKHDTPYAYTTKPPPPSVFAEWAKAKGFKPRDKNGKFITNKAFGFIMSRHIFSKGQKPTKFFSLSFEQQFKKLPEEIVKAFNLDLDNFLDFTT